MPELPLSAQRNSSWEGKEIGPDLPDHLKFLADVPPVPAGAHEKCAGSGRCQTMFIGGVTCGALFSKCALHPMESVAADMKKAPENLDGFSEFVVGLKARHPGLFASSLPAEIREGVSVGSPDHKSAAAGDDWAEEVSVGGYSEDSNDLGQ